MSQFDSLSEHFKASMESFGDDLKSRKEKADAEASREVAMLKDAQAFIEGPLRVWYSSLAEDEMAEVNRVFAEIKSFEPTDILRLMRAEGATTPLGLLDGLFSVAEKNVSLDVVEEEGSTGSPKN